MALQEEFEKQGNWLFRYRSFLPFIIILIGGAIYLWKEVHPGNFFLESAPWKTYYFYFCMLVSFLGFGFRVYTVGYTPANTSGRNTKVQIADLLNTTGIYSAVRHPLYLGNFFMWFGPCLLTGNIWFILIFCLVYWIYYERIMYSEEQFLRRKFGPQYTDWAENVPAFIPSFKNFKKSAYPFSWVKILKKEKNGFAAIFILFSLLDIAGHLVKGDTHFDYFLFICAWVAIILYLVLKYLKRKTHVLDQDGR
jgi:protein-S-isoprenylcysteine O-methyltransferase Ste14